MNLRMVAGAVLLIAVLASGWSVWHQRSQDDNSVDSGRSGYILRDFELTALDKNGKESFTLRAPFLQETPHATSMELDNPVFFIPDREDSSRYWEVQSKVGWVSPARDQIRLSQAVQARSPTGAPNPTTLQTERLNLFPDTRLATSDTVVTVSQPGLTMRGRGMQANLATKQIKLQSEVRNTYAPRRR